MAEIRHILDGEQRGEPRNWQELQIKFSWLDEKEEGAVSTTSLEFVGDQQRYIRERLFNGLTGGVGIFEGIPYNIEVGQQGNPAFTFHGYIDGSDSATFIGNEEITAPIKKLTGDDWLNDVADGFSFGYLQSIGAITPADFVKVPYVINYVPDAMQTIMLSFSLYMLIKEEIENAQELAELIGQTVNASTPVLGVGVGVGAVVVTAWDLGDWIMFAIYVAAKVVYMIAITIAIVNLIKQLLEQIFPKLRYHLGMSFYTLIKKGCEHLGLELQSTLLESIKDQVYIPSKDRKGGDDGETGAPGNNDPIYLFGDAIRLLKQRHNADHKIVDGKFIFERRDYWQNVSSFTMASVFNNQERLLNQFTPNTAEFVANYNVHYQYDTQDQNTLDDVTGLSFQAITKPVTVNNLKMVHMKGLTEIAMPFALGKRKDGLTVLEKFAKGVFKIVDNVTGIFGGGTNFVSKIEAREGALLLSSHFITVGKIVVMNGNQLARDQREIIGAKAIYNDYHKINSFVEIDGVHNQWLTYPETRVPITEDELRTILQNNYFTTAEGKKAMIEVLNWQPYAGTAVISYRVNELYTKNLKIEYVG